MFKSLLGNHKDKFEPLSMKVEMLRRYNPEDLEDLHDKVVSLSEQLQFEEYEPARNALVSLMNVYVQAIDGVLNATPVSLFPFTPLHPNTDEDPSGELRLHKEFRESINKEKGHSK